MTPEDAYGILEMVAKINGLECNLRKYVQTKEEVADEQLAERVKIASANRHHFKDIDFASSLTGKRYHGTTAIDGTLSIIDVATGEEIPNNSKPSKKSIIGQAILDLGGETSKEETLYQRYHKLTKIILSSLNQ